nr:MAG TPA: hypothetical protein [Siphoviridae sp. ctDlU28]
MPLFFYIFPHIFPIFVMRIMLYATIYDEKTWENP